MDRQALPRGVNLEASSIQRLPSGLGLNMLTTAISVESLLSLETHSVRLDEIIVFALTFLHVIARVDPTL